MKKGLFTVTENSNIADRTLRMTLAGDASAIVRPGQFVNVEIEGLYLRRPISVCDWDAGKVVLVYKVVGAGTQKLARLRPGAALDLAHRPWQRLRRRRFRRAAAAGGRRRGRAAPLRAGKAPDGGGQAGDGGAGLWQRARGHSGR